MPDLPYDLTRNDATFVMVGDFNPRIFQPRWLASVGAFGPMEETEVHQNIDAGLGMIHPDRSEFSVDPLAVVVTRDRLVVGVKEEPFERGRDFIATALQELPHTPVRLMGINRRVDFRMRSVEGWHHLGDELAPKTKWKFLLGEPNVPVTERKGGLEELAMRLNKPPAEGIGRITVKIGPIMGVPGGCFIDINDHFSTVDPPNVHGAREILEMMEEKWEGSLTRSWGYVVNLLEMAQQADSESEVRK